MIHVALAGCSSNFGLTLLHHFIASKKHKITLLSRDAKPDLSALGVNVQPIDYFDHAALTNALRGVDTVISCIFQVSDSTEYDPKRDAQLALIRAARAAGVRRFAPSDFAHGSSDGIDMYAYKRAAWDELVSQGGEMEYTRFSCGLFMNILATGTTNVDQTEALAGLRPWNFVVNMKAGTADLPGDGGSAIAWTEIHDVCRYVVASVDLPEWPKESVIVGDRASFNEVIALAEEIRGGEKFLTKTNNIEAMEKDAEQPQLRFFNQVRVALAKGEFDIQPTLNQLIPDIKPLSIRDVLQKWWARNPLVNPSWDKDHIADLSA